MSGVKGKFFWKIFTVLARSPSLCLAHKHTHCTNTTSTHSRCVWLARPAPKDSFVDWFGLGASWKEDLSSRESSPAQQCCALCYCLVLSRVAIFSNNNSFFFSACCCCCRGCHNPSNETKGGRRHLLCVRFFRVRFSYKVFLFFFFLLLFVVRYLLVVAFESASGLIFFFLLCLFDRVKTVRFHGTPIPDARIKSWQITLSRSNLVLLLVAAAHCHRREKKCGERSRNRLRTRLWLCGRCTWLSGLSSFLIKRTSSSRISSINC